MRCRVYGSPVYEIDPVEYPVKDEFLMDIPFDAETSIRMEYNPQWLITKRPFFKLYVNGSLVFTTTVINAYNDDHAPFIKIGPYQFDWGATTATQRRMRFKDVTYDIVDLSASDFPSIIGDSLDISNLLDNCSLVYIPFDDGALATTARVVTMENGAAVEVFDGNELPIGTTTIDPFAHKEGYFTPRNKSGENEDNYTSIKRGDSELLLPDWLQNHFRLDTLVGNGHLVFGGYCYFKDGTDGGQVIMGAELGTNPVVGGGVGVAMASGEKIAGYMR